MKKLSLLIALCMLLSIGGVYATWTYAGAEMKESHKHMDIQLADPDSTNVEEGSILNILNTMTATLDDTDNDHQAEVVITGKMVFVFKAGHGSSDEIQTNGLPLQFQVENRNPLNYTYDGETMAVFTVANGAKTSVGTLTKITSANIDELEARVGNGVQLDSYVDAACFYFEVTYEQVNGRFDSELKLPTLEDYNAFDTWLASVNTKEILGITISKEST